MIIIATLIIDRQIVSYIGIYIWQFYTYYIDRTIDNFYNIILENRLKIMKDNVSSTSI